MSRASDLYALQEVDLRLDSHRSICAGLEERLGESDELLAVHELLAQAEESHAALLARQQRLERDLQDLQSKINPRQKKLYDGSIRNPKELASLQEEVEMEQRQKAKVEEELLEIMAAVEEAEQLVASARSHLDQVEQAWRREQEALRQEIERLLAEIASLEEERRRRAGVVQNSDLALYDVLRQRRQGLAVAKVERGLCQGCRISLPMTLLQKVRSGQTVVQCVNCERILYGG